MTNPSPSRSIVVRVAVAALALAVLGGPSGAEAATATVPRLVISPSALSFSKPGDARTLTLTNAGTDVLRLGPLSIVTTGARAVTDFVVDAPGSRELEPGATVTLAVTFRPPPAAVPAQAFAALLVPAEDPELPTDLDLRTGVPVARRMATVALRAGQTHALTWMFLLPLLGAGLLLRVPARRARPVALVAAAAPLALAAWVIAFFDPTFSVADGSYGLQLVAHVPLIRALGFEYFVGVDGVSLLFVLLAPVAGVVAMSVATSPVQDPPPPASSFAAVLLVQAGATGVFVAQDGLLFAAFWALAAVGLASLVRGPSRWPVLASAALVLLAVVALRAQSAPTYLVDGTPAARAFDLAKLTHARGLGAASGHASAFVAAATWGVLLVAFALVLPLFPFSAPKPTRALAGASDFLFAGLVSKMAIYGLARLAVPLRPEQGVLLSIGLALGALGAVRAALLATRAEGLAGVAARAGDFYTAVAVLGILALAPAGIAGALALAFAHGLVVALLFALGSPPAARARGTSLAALAASLGAPGLAPFVGFALVVFDAAPRRPALAIVILAAFAVLTGAHARVGLRLLSTAAAPAPLDRRALVVVVPLALLVLALGLVPAPILSSITTGVLDLARLGAI